MNSLLWWISGVSCAALALVPLATWLHRRAVARAIDTVTVYLRRQIEDMSGELDSAREAREAARAERDRYLVKVSDLAQERDAWMNLQRREAIGHGNAQNLMMQTIDGLGRQLQQAGKTPKIPAVIAQVREEFQAKFEDPARREDPVALNPSQKPS